MTTALRQISDELKTLINDNDRLNATITQLSHEVLRLNGELESYRTPPTVVEPTPTAMPGLLELIQTVLPTQVSSYVFPRAAIASRWSPMSSLWPSSG